MSYPRRPRSVIAQLMDAGKLRRGCEWPEIDAEIGITKSTRENWLNGNVRSLPLRGVMALAEALRISHSELADAVLRDSLPEWALPPIEATGEAAEQIHEEIAQVLGEKASGRSGRRAGRGRRPRSNGPSGA